MKNLLAFLAIVMVIGATALYINQRTSLFATDKAVVAFGDIKVEAVVADTPKAQTKGLSGRSGLGVNEGMLFVFDEAAYHAFHMKDMKFPIDIIWLSESKKVVDITANARPDSYPKTFQPYKPAMYVLEVPAGFAATYGIKVGDKTIIEFQ